MCDNMVCTLEEFDILLDVLQLECLFSFQEQTKFSLDSVKPHVLRVEFYDFFFSCPHSSVEFTDVGLVKA